MNTVFLKPKFPKFSHIKDHFAKMYKNYQFSNNGEMVQRLEKKAAAIFDFDGDVITCANGTVTLMLAAKAMGLRKVVIPSFTFSATAQALHWADVEYDYVDIDAETWSVDIEALEKMLSSGEYDGVMPVHSFGTPCDVVSISRLAAIHNTKVIYDAAPAISSFVNEGGKANHVCRYGDISSFSLHATKALPAGEGGMLFVQDPYVADSIRRMCNFGFNDERVPTERYGMNAKMSEIHACFALEGLEKLSFNQRDRISLVERYHHNLKDYFSFQKIPDGDISTYQVFSVLLPDGGDVYRDGIVVRMQEQHGIQCRKYYNPCLHKIFNGSKGEVTLPNTEDVASRIVTLPLHLWMNNEEVDKVCDALIESCRYFTNTSERFPSAVI